MQILVLRHEKFEGLGHFTDALESKGILFAYRDLGTEFSGWPKGFDSLIVMGGPMSANDSLPGLADELKLIDHALGQNMPILGVCLGSQLIAKTLGARVYRNEKLEVGWEPVHFTDAGRADPMFGDVSSPTMFFHWHGETFDLPNGAEWLAHSEKTRHQAFRYRDNVYGLQFHPEITPEMIEDWQSQPCNCGDVATLERPIDSRAFDQSHLAAKIIDGWLAAAHAERLS
jgi:GMP synthase (glutamine-hydrolysing)